MKLFQKILGTAASAIARQLFTTTVVTNDYTTNSRSELMEFLRELEFRASLCETGNANYRYFQSMTSVMREQLGMAASNWAGFCDKYTCVISHNGKYVQSAKSFRIHIKEKGVSAPKHWEAQFRNFTY